MNYVIGMKPIIMENDPDKKKELFLKYNTETIQPHLQKIEAHLVKNGTGFLVGDSVPIFFYFFIFLMLKVG